MKTGSIVAIVGTSVLMGLMLIGGLAAGCPHYNVWQQGLAGQAKLRRAEQEKLIMISQAKAEVEAAKYRAQAIEAVGKAAKAYPEYRTQEFIGAFAEALANGDIDQIIYVPTEAGIPIVENRRINKN